MKSGDIVDIYEDPHTCEVLEGRATLLKKTLYENEVEELWVVRFEGDAEDEVSIRKVNKNKH